MMWMVALSAGFLATEATSPVAHTKLYAMTFPAASFIGTAFHASGCCSGGVGQGSGAAGNRQPDRSSNSGR